MLSTVLVSERCPVLSKKVLKILGKFVFLGDEQNTKTEENSLKTDNLYHVIGTLGSTLIAQDKLPWASNCSLGP